MRKATNLFCTKLHYGTSQTRTIRSGLPRSKMKDKTVGSKPKKKSNEDKDAKNKCCYNCGEKDHRDKNCPNKSKGIKCFSCGKFRYPAGKCLKKVKTLMKFAFKTNIEITNANDKKTYKEVNILGRKEVGGSNKFRK